MIPFNFTKMKPWKMTICGCELCVITRSLHKSLLAWRCWKLKSLKDRIDGGTWTRNTQNLEEEYSLYREYCNGDSDIANQGKPVDVCEGLVCKEVNNSGFPPWSCVLR